VAGGGTAHLLDDPALTVPTVVMVARHAEPARRAHGTARASVNLSRQDDDNLIINAQVGDLGVHVYWVCE